MLQAIEGSQAIALAVSLCRPQVVAAYPITPQTHIVENISRLVADGEFECEFVSVESEFSAASVVLGAALAGSRAYTASASQGIMLMTEVLYNISGLRVPLVMTCANRAVGAPLSIWNDQQDSMSVRDAGWIQLYCADNQEAVDTTIQAYRIAESCELPVMVCVDGFTLTHTLETIDIPASEIVDRFLPEFQFSRSLDPTNPITIGTLISPDYYPEARHSHHRALEKSQSVIEEVDREWAELAGRSCGGLLAVDGPAEAKIGIVVIGSVYGTLHDARELHDDLPATRFIKLRCFRPFPVERLLAECADLDELIVVERAISPGSGGIVTAEIRSALATLDRPPRVHGFAAGLGGRDVPLELYRTLHQRIAAAERAIHFEIIDTELDRLPAEDR
jgi:pyruvate ferredoxin oxidoreductase alpha subunit